MIEKWFTQILESMNLDLVLTVLPVTFFISVLLTVVALPEVIRIAFKKQLFDVPDYRKVHHGQVPRLGGFTFLPGIMIAVFLAFGFLMDIPLPPSTRAEILFGAAGALFLYMAGVADDLEGLSYRVKFPIQIVAAFLLCSSGLWIDDLHGIFGIHQLHPAIGIPFSVVLVVLIINAINLIDGIDGLASGLCIMMTTVFAVLFIWAGLFHFAVIAVATLGVLLPFYIYNVYGTSENRTKIFMGDAGSLTMGYIVAAFAIKAAIFAGRHPELNADPEFGFVYAFAVLIVPVLDVLRLFCHRLLHRRSPFEPDRCHIHHKFLAVGLTIGQTRHLIIGISLIFFLVNILLAGHVNINIILAADIAAWTIMHVVISRRIRVLQSRHAECANNYME